MIRTVTSAGGSPALIIPQGFRETLNIKLGDKVDVSLSLDGKIEIKPINNEYGNK
ncbi:AbrB/MazE/SpoVT family DNA-binding domain-containing protein [Clostridium butyricum]|uniref:AbrB/MazE/SpoVT family DNA-binding domain-containing protein n=1 Tax=Clostridium butyricum TaxID=1492 RepID=UPI0009094423|nr:AbrB/MazE/SpoVT family DNA-binding domain-containing protein [Clostridium butyricum]APF21540.1 transcriptional regulator, AbrB family domain protein [Clostridium butyricum]